MKVLSQLRLLINASLRLSSVASLLISLVISLILRSPTSYAAEISFTGEITNITCSIKINGVNGSQTIRLAPVRVADLPLHNSVAGATEFTAELYGCSEIYQGYVKVASRPLKVLVPGIAGYPGGASKPAHYLGNMATVNAAKGVHFYLESQSFDGVWGTVYSPYQGGLLGVLFDHFRPGMNDMISKARVSYVRDMSPETGSAILVPGYVQSAVQYSLIYD